MNAKTPTRQDRTRGERAFLFTLLLPWLLGVLAFAPALAEGREAAEAREARVAPRDYLLHLPGIAGYRWIDEEMLNGLTEGGYAGELRVHDWPGEKPGLNALLAQEKNRRQAQLVADAIAARRRENPNGRILLTAHSGGAGILIWALEKLPEDVQVDEVVLLAPALSPEYDLSTALSHVRGRLYAFTSQHDGVVLGAGTRAFGTIDGVHGDAAGRVGFRMPDGADEEQYEKLVPMPYDPKWIKAGNIGDHIGPMSRKFARKVLAPLVAREDDDRR